MEYEETEENISRALTELNAIKNKIGSTGSDQMFARFNNAVKILSSKGPVGDRLDSLDFGYYDDSKNAIIKYIQGEDSDELYTPGFNLTTFLIDHYGNSEQFALALSLIFASDKNIMCYPVKVRIKFNDGLEEKEIYHYISFVEFLDDDGTYITSNFLDIYNNVSKAETFEELSTILKEKYSSETKECIDIVMEGLSYFENDLDISKNFTIIQTMTDAFVMEFNYEAFNLDSSNAELEKCADIKNYLNSKDLSKCLKNYLS